MLLIKNKRKIQILKIDTVSFPSLPPQIQLLLFFLCILPEIYYVYANIFM